jgi:NADPH:quinone reductase
MPCIPGFEGSGLVVQSGGGFMGWKNGGKRVSFSASDAYYGCWAEYTVVDSA